MLCKDIKVNVSSCVSVIKFTAWNFCNIRYILIQVPLDLYHIIEQANNFQDIEYKKFINKYTSLKWEKNV